MNELDKKRPGTSRMSERFGPNFAPGSFALQQSIRLVYTLRALSRGRNRATRATGTTRMHTQKEHTHARQRRHNTTASPRLRKGAGRCCCRAAATAAAAAAAAAAAVLLLCCCCFPTRDASRSTTRHNRLFLVLCFLQRTQDRVTIQQQQQQQQQQVQQQGRPKHMYEYTIRRQAG